MERLTASDATHILSERGKHIARVVDGYVFEPVDGAAVSPGVDEILDWLRPRVEHSPVFRSRIRRYPLDLDFPYWVPHPAFDLRDHVTVESARGPGWEPVRERISETCVSVVPLSRPPWELLVITGLSGIEGVSDGSWLVVLKVHHAVGDGVLMVELARELFAPEPFPAGPRHEAVSSGVALVRAVGRLPVVAFGFLRGSLRAQFLNREAVAAAARGEITSPRWRWPSTRFNRRSGSGFAFDAVTVDLADIVAVRSRYAGITASDVIAGVIGGALARYLGEYGEVPSESLGGKIAYSMRGIADSRSNNNFVVMSVDLHTDIADPVERLFAIHESMEAEKARFRHPVVAELADALDVAPAPYVSWLVWRRSRLPIGEGPTVALGNTMISNVPRRADDMRFLGRRAIEGFGVLGIGDGTCLNHYVASVGDRVTISFAVDPAAMPDRVRYAALLRDELRVLTDLVEEPELEQA